MMAESIPDVEGTGPLKEGFRDAPPAFRAGEADVTSYLRAMFEKGTINMSHVSTDVIPSLGSSDLIGTLTTDYDTPRLVCGVPSKLTLRIFNSGQTVVLVEDVDTGAAMNVNDYKDVISKLCSAALNRAKRDFVLIDDYESELFGAHKIVKRGTHGLDPFPLATCNTSLINAISTVMRQLEPLHQNAYRIQLPGLFMQEEAEFVNVVFDLVTDAVQVAACSDRMTSMERMLVDHDGINTTYPSRVVGEQFLASADGAGSQLWRVPGVATTLTRAAIEITCPLFAMYTPNPTLDMTALRSSTNRMHYSQAFVNLEMTPDLGTEVSCILAAMLYPGQVEVLIKSETAEIAESPIDHLGAFFSKFFLSMTPGLANISLSTAERLDGYIAALFGIDGVYRIPGGGTLEFAPDGRNRDFSRSFNILSSRV